MLPSAPGLHRVQEGMPLPIIIVRGSSPGQTLLVSAGVLGDEYGGVRAIFETCAALDPTSLSGQLIALPIVNYPAHRACSRTHPADGGNLARAFPGCPGGSPTERLAWAFAQSFLALADFYLDLHSAGVRFAMPSLVGFEAADPRGRAAAEAFGAPVIWGHPVPFFTPKPAVPGASIPTTCS